MADTYISTYSDSYGDFQALQGFLPVGRRITVVGPTGRSAISGTVTALSIQGANPQRGVSRAQ